MEINRDNLYSAGSFKPDPRKGSAPTAAYFAEQSVHRDTLIKRQEKGPLRDPLVSGGEGGIDSSGAAFAALTLTGRSTYGLRVQTLPWAEFVEPAGSSIPSAPSKPKKRALVGPFFGFGGEGGITQNSLGAVLTLRASPLTGLGAKYSLCRI